MFPINSYRSQAPNRAHFGLADAACVDRLEIRWPSGQVQELRDLPADQHVVITEGDPAPEKVVPGQTIRP